MPPAPRKSLHRSPSSTKQTGSVLQVVPNKKALANARKPPAPTVKPPGRVIELGSSSGEDEPKEKKRAEVSTGRKQPARLTPSNAAASSSRGTAAAPADNAEEERNKIFTSMLQGALIASCNTAAVPKKSETPSNKRPLPEIKSAPAIDLTGDGDESVEVEIVRPGKKQRVNGSRNEDVEVVVDNSQHSNLSKSKNTKTDKGKNKEIERAASPQKAELPTIPAIDFEEDITCCICYEILLGPVNLNCGHVFCSSCVEDWLAKNAKQCPTCRQVSNDPTRALTIETIIEKFLQRELSVLRASGKTSEADKQQSERVQRERQIQIDRMAKAQAKNRRDAEAAAALERERNLFRQGLLQPHMGMFNHRQPPNIPAQRHLQIDNFFNADLERRMQLDQADRIHRERQFHRGAMADRLAAEGERLRAFARAVPAPPAAQNNARRGPAAVPRRPPAQPVAPQPNAARQPARNAAAPANPPARRVVRFNPADYAAELLFGDDSDSFDDSDEGDYY